MLSKRTFFRSCMVLVGISIPFGTSSLVNAAERCISFRPLGASGYEVRKSVSSTGTTPGVRNNWDTDFVVPGGIRFTQYITTITSETPENYTIIINFRYPDNTAEQKFRRDGARLVGGVPLQIKIAQTATGRQPFQINTNIRARQGTTYRVRVSGCTRR